MANQLRITLEIGPKGKKVAAVAPDWPGLERGAKTGEAAIERLQSYLPRYAQVAKLAGMDEEFAAINTVNIVEQYLGTGSTDFWGISFAFSSIDRQDISRGELERELTLMQACWAFFDDVRWRVSAEMVRLASLIGSISLPSSSVSSLSFFSRMSGLMPSAWIERPLGV